MLGFCRVSIKNSTPCFSYFISNNNNYIRDKIVPNMLLTI